MRLRCNDEQPAWREVTQLQSRFKSDGIIQGKQRSTSTFNRSWYFLDKQNRTLSNPCKENDDEVST